MVSGSVLEKVRRIPKSWIFLGLVILFVVFVRTRLLEIPLERDEGEYAYMGQLLLHGVPPYSSAYNMKFPGTYLMYALLMAIFGQTGEGIHIGLMIVNCAAIVLVYQLARKMIGGIPSAFAAGAFGILSLSSSVFGFAGHATHFIVLPALGGTVLLLHAREKEKTHLYFLSGSLLGISVVMKQPGIFFVLFAATCLLYDHIAAGPVRSLNKLFLRLGTFSLGASLPLLITVLWLYLAGVFPTFWFWTFVYASRYGARLPLSDLFGGFKANFPAVIDGFFVFWIFSALGFITLFFQKGLKVNKAFVVLFVFFSFLSICTGFYFRRHYFITLLPAAALLAGLFVDFLIATAPPFLNRFSTVVAAGIFIAAAAIGVVAQKDSFFVDDPVKLSSAIYAGNPFPESVEIARFIEERTTPDDRIAVLGSEPQIFFYAKRRSATGYIYMYSLMESHEYALQMQKEMIGEVEASRPKFLIDVRSGLSWLQHDESESYIFRWLDGYVAANYVLVGVADLIYPYPTIYKWYNDARGYQTQSPTALLIYERR